MPGSAQVVAFERFDTTPLPTPRRLPVWREAIDVLFDVSPAEADAAEGAIVLDNWLIGPAVLTVGQGPGFSYQRSPRKVARDGRDMLMVQVYHAGQCRFMEGAPEITSSPGDLVITDFAHPVRTQESAFRNINLFVPRPLLADMLREPDTGGSRVVRGDRPLVALARAHLIELCRNAHGLPASIAPQVLTASLQLIAAAINGECSDATESGVQAMLATRVRHHIVQHLDDSDLSPETLAGRFGVSRATLYRLFAADGGVRRYVQKRRLERARLALADSMQRHRTIGEIGEAAGYAYPQDFVRAFRNEFAITPSTQRDGARNEARARLVRTDAARLPWVDWLRRIG